MLLLRALRSGWRGRLFRGRLHPVDASLNPGPDWRDENAEEEADETERQRDKHKDYRSEEKLESALHRVISFENIERA